MHPRSQFPVLLGLIALLGCTPPAERKTLPHPTPFPAIVESLRQDLELERHPSDGQGKAWIEEAQPRRTIRAGERGRWRLVYEAGEPGIAEGGMLFLQVSPFFGWSTPQTFDSTRPGFTLVSTQAEGVRLEASNVDQHLLAVRIEGRALLAGEQIRIEYGAGPAYARVDRFAERETRFWIAVDGDGDGVRELIADSPTIDIDPGPAARMVLLLPSSAGPGDTVELTLTVLDRNGNAFVDVDGEFELVVTGTATIQPSIQLENTDAGWRRIPLQVQGEGIVRVRAVGPHGLEAESNPLAVASSAARILWADLHGHSHYSDGTGTPEDYFRYARDIAALDVVALTDHDHYGIRALATHPEMWEEIQRNVRDFHEPGTFVTLLGYEWTNWIHGHRHVLYFRDEGDVLSALDPQYESPDLLWDALGGQEALTFAHHSAGGPIGIDWNIVPDPVLEPVTEIVSVHGSSEAEDSPGLIYSPIAGNFVRDILDHGYRLGFIGSGDSHDGHPGLAHMASPNGGLAAILSEDRTREGVLEALRARRVYATNGPRIVLRTSLAGHRMGTILTEWGERAELRCVVVAEKEIDHVDLIQDGHVVESISGSGARFMSFEREVKGLESGSYLYVRVIQIDGGAAWTSPFFFE